MKCSVLDLRQTLSEHVSLQTHGICRAPNENVRRAATTSHKVLVLKGHCSLVVFYITSVCVRDPFMRALFSKEVTVINTSTCPKQQYPLFCSQLTNGQNCLPHSILQDLYSICLVFAVRAQLYVLFCEEPLG